MTSSPKRAPTPIGGLAPGTTRIGTRTYTWGERTLIMGIINVTPDSFSGDGLLGTAGGQDPVVAAVMQGEQMVAEGADLLDVGGESTRPGHEPVDEAEELRRIVPVVAALHAALPDVPISIDTTKSRVAAEAIDAGATLLNDIWGVRRESLAGLAAERGLPIVLMHNRTEPRYDDLLGEIVGDLQAAIDRAITAGVEREAIIVDPGFGFGKTAEQNLVLMARLGELRQLGRPILLGTSRKSTLGRVLDLPPADRVEATLATTALGIAAGVDIVRVHDVRPNARVARVSDAIVRGVPLPAAAVAATPTDGGRS